MEALLRALCAWIVTATASNADKFSAASYEILAGILVEIFTLITEILREFFAVIANILGLLKIFRSTRFIEPVV